MSDSEYSETLDVNGQDESENNGRAHLQLLQQKDENLDLMHYPQQQQNVGYMSYAGSTSSSAESSISSTSSDESDEGDSEDTLELARITKEVLRLPRGLCENASIFHEFFSLETWQELPISLQNYLQQFLPSFNKILPPQIAAVEQTRTISMLFNNELTCFGESPLENLQQQLELGNCRPDIIKLRQNIMKSQRREQRFQYCESLSQTAKQLFLCRQRLLDTAYNSSPDTVLKAPPTNNSRQPRLSHLFADNKLSAMRARKRFYSEISQIAQQLGFKEDTILSADEEDDKYLEDEEMKVDNEMQQRNVENSNETVKTSVSLNDRCIYSTIFKKLPDIANEEALRLQQKTNKPKLSNRNFRNYLREHKRRKLTEPTLPEFETSDIRLRDVCARAQMGGNFKRVFAFGRTPGRRTKITNTPTKSSTKTTMPSMSTATSITSATNSIISNMSTSTTTVTGSPTMIALPPPPLPPPPKLSEPPALVPIQPTLKKPDTFQMLTTTLKSPQKEYQQNSITATHLDLQHKLNTSSNNSNDTLNISQLMSVSNHADNLNLCIDDSSLLTGDHDAFNMLDGEVELQQEEVETFASTCEETIPAFVIGSDVVMSSNRNNNDVSEGLLNVRGSHYQQKQLENIVSQPVPKLEPISRLSLISQKSSNSTTGSELIQETHACFFSLIRDFFCSTSNHRMRYEDLRHKIDIWLRNPITALNEWYSLSDNWSNLLRSGINFLVGEFPDLPDEYVPYIEHKVQLNIYQWIGAGRDSDTRLSELCTLWMEKRKQPNDKHTSNVVQNELKLEICPRNLLENDDSREANSDNGGVLTPPPPPPRCPTTWTVRAATLEEITVFQKQEKDRFEQPHKAYTYRMHGYESVVGPVKGIYTPMLALSKARGHSMMVGDRPNFVTILTLVRDATARLPNGEGTRAEISELLKCSQYINRDASENVLQTIVSGALDRMHTEHDPCVRYDPKRKIWIYLHRNRTEEEFERIHQQNQTIGKMKKLPQRKLKPISSQTTISGSKPTDDDLNLLGSSETNSVPKSGSLITMPALVPSNPIIITSNVQKQQQVQQQQLLNSNKYPPVPPLKYNIPPAQTNNIHQQKSLLKTAIRADNKTILTSNANTSNNIVKQHNFQITPNKNNYNHKTTPIIVATPQGLQTVHVSNATSVIPSQTKNQQPNSSQQHTTLTANLAGKKVTLNKPIIINQITQQLSTSSTPSTTAISISNQKLKSPQQLMQKSQLIQNRITLQTNQHQILTQQQQQSNLIIPISMASNMTLQSSNIADQTSSSSNQSSTLGNKQNIIRLVPAANVKTLMNSPTSTQIVNRQRMIANNSISDRPGTLQQQKQKCQTGLQLLSSNGNVVTVSSGSSNQAGSIVKMSPQQFASLQQKHGQQQHIIVKPIGGNKTPTAIATGNKPQRVILGNTSIVGQAGQGKNIILQQIPVASTPVVVTSTQTAAASSTTTTVSGNIIQTINAKNLTPQQQRILIQNIKQQQQQQQQQHQQIINQNQIQFKTVQIVGNTSGLQTGMTGRSQVTVATNQQVAPKTTVVMSQDSVAQQQQQQQQNVTRIPKTTPQLKTEVSAATLQGTRVITSSSGQIISLDNLIQKQGGTLRLAGTGNTQNIKSNQQIVNVIQKSQQTQQQQVKQQQPQQFAIVSVPNSIISLGNNSNFTIGKKIITTQARSSNTTSLISLDTTKVTPSIVPTGTGRVITATTAGTKIITKQSAAASPGNIHVINTVNQPRNINLATLQGKQVVLATGKTMNTITKAQLQSQQQQQQQNVVRAPSGSIVIGNQTVKLQQGNTNVQQLLKKSGNIVANPNSSSNLTTGSTQLQTVIMGNQILRVQQIPQIVSSANRLNVSNTKTINSNMNNNVTTTNSNAPKTIFVGSTGQTLRLQPTSSQTQTIANKNIVVQAQQQNSSTKLSSSANTTTPNRVVLAVQGGTQIFLSPNFQGGNINFKSLQNMKVVSLAQQPTTTKFKDTSITSASSSSLTTQQAILKATSTPTSSDTNG